MAFTDKTLQCVQCGSSFTFTASEQEAFAHWGFTHEPKRCPVCRSPGPDVRAERNREWYEFERLCREQDAQQEE